MHSAETKASSLFSKPWAAYPDQRRKSRAAEQEFQNHQSYEKTREPEANGESPLPSVDQDTMQASSWGDWRKKLQKGNAKQKQKQTAAPAAQKNTAVDVGAKDQDKGVPGLDVDLAVHNTESSSPRIIVPNLALNKDQTSKQGGHLMSARGDPKKVI
jgi:hypothetical protein